VPYADLDDDAQVEVLRPAALAGAEAFGLDVARMEPVAHAFNTTFALDTVEGGRWALRVHTNSVSTPENVRAQLAWQRALAEESEVEVPVPRQTRDGQWFAEVACAGFGGPVLVTVSGWLDGPDVGEPGAEVASALGRAMARLHQHAAGWRVPEGASLARFDTPLFGDPDLLADLPGLDDGERTVLDRAREQCDDAFVRLLRSGQRLHVLHADLHGGNLKWHRGALAVFDFDDCGLGLPVLDLAITTFYLRDGTDTGERALRAGYAEVAAVPEVDPADFEALVAARQLLLANALLSTTTADLRDEAADYLVTTVARLRHWLGTGRFTRALPA
jgi:Ser/Thr protein kinase RdoA (MazF antagonist)